MTMLKKRIAIFLCMLMAITTVAAYLPAAQVKVEAATYFYEMYGRFGGFSETKPTLSTATDFLVIAEGVENLYAGDLLYGNKHTEDWSKSIYYSTMKDVSGVSYGSKDETIVKVNSSTGKITAKKTGQAIIYVKWKGISLYAAVEVVSAKDVQSYRTANKSAISAAKKFAAAYDGKVTSSNVVRLLKLAKNLNDSFTDGYNGIQYSTTIENDVWKSDVIVYSTEILRAVSDSSDVYSYCSTRNPFSTTGSYTFKISSLSGSGKTVKATLNKAVSADQYVGAQYYYMWNEDIKISTSSLSFPIYIRDTKSGDIYSATATIKKGSKTIGIKSSKSLKKGKKYELIQFEFYDEAFESQNWIHTGKSTFTAS